MASRPSASARVWSGLFFLAFTIPAVAAEQILYDGLFADGSRVAAVPLAGWHAPASQPQLGGKPILDAVNPVRWVVRQTPPASAAMSQPFVEFACGDRLPGVVEQHVSGIDDWRLATSPHLVVRPLAAVDPPGRPPRAHVRVASEQVRRIVLAPRAGGPIPPATILTRDIREIAFRSLRFSGRGVIALTADGPQKLSFDEVAEIRMPDRDPWDSYARMVAWLAPQAAGAVADVPPIQLMRQETDDGLVATTVSDSLRGSGDANNPRSWHLLAQPAWSLDPLWLPHAAVWRRVVFPVHEPPLSLIEPSAVNRQATFGGSWTWRVDRNVQGDPLVAGGVPFGQGFGTQARSEMTFPLPDYAVGFRTFAALDQAAGSGGCVRLAVHAGDARSPPLWQSEMLIGSREPVDTGPLALGGAGESTRNKRSLVLVADAAHDGRPDAADPHDIRDIVDWLDPVVSLDRAGLSAAVRDRLAGTIAAWRDWEVEGEPAIRTVVDPLAPAESPVLLRQSLAAGDETVLSRRLEVVPETEYLVVAASRTGGSPSRLDIRIDGRVRATADVPERKAGQTVQPFVFPLAGFVGRSIDVEVVHVGSDDKGFVEWGAVGLTGPLGTRWQVVVPTTLTAESRATFRQLDDGSVLVGGPSADKDVHILEIDTDRGSITGLRLEALRDDSLPAGGTGRSANGSFVLQACEAEAISRANPERRKSLTFAKAAASFASSGHAPETIIDGIAGTGWSIYGCPKDAGAAAILTLAEPAGFAGGSRIRIVMRYGSGGQHVLGRFRLALTTDPQPQLGVPATILADVTVPPKK
jgi:hypothetical protein